MGNGQFDTIASTKPCFASHRLMTPHNPSPAQVRVTGGLGQLLPSFLPSFLLGTPAALEQVVVDPERHVLYTLAADNMLQVGGRPAGRAGGELMQWLQCWTFCLQCRDVVEAIHVPSCPSASP